jgi:hypothetical protein
MHHHATLAIAYNIISECFFMLSYKFIEIKRGKIRQKVFKYMNDARAGIEANSAWIMDSTLSMQVRMFSGLRSYYESYQYAYKE